MKRHPLHTRWRAMMERCGSPKHPSYANYGGRGIVVCEEWHDFEKFAFFWGRMPVPGLSMERMDVDGPYSPENCRWEARKGQARNKTNTLWVEYQGEKIALADLAEMTGIPRSTLADRIKHMSVEDAVALQRKRGRPPKQKAAAVQT